MQKFKIRSARFSGKLYPKDKLNLEREIALYLETANIERKSDDVKGIILPYGDYRITGGVMARALVHILQNKIKNVIMIAPTYQAGRAGAEIYYGDGFETPLGIVTVDKKKGRKIFEETESFATYDGVWNEDNEAGIETVLPFLQSILGNFKLLPVLVGELNDEENNKLSDALAGIAGEQDTVVILNLNLSIGSPYEKAIKEDENMLTLIRQFSLNDIYRKVNEELVVPSKIDALYTFMQLMRKLGRNNIEVLTYRNSGDITGDKEQTDGYFSAVVF